MLPGYRRKLLLAATALREGFKEVNSVQTAPTGTLSVNATEDKIE